MSGPRAWNERCPQWLQPTIQTGMTRDASGLEGKLDSVLMRSKSMHPQEGQGLVPMPLALRRATIPASSMVGIIFLFVSSIIFSYFIT